MRLKRMFIAFLAAVLALTMMPGTGAVSYADSVEVRPYLAFGADLSSSQKKQSWSFSASHHRNWRTMRPWK